MESVVLILSIALALSLGALVYMFIRFRKQCSEVEVSLRKLGVGMFATITRTTARIARGDLNASIDHAALGDEIPIKGSPEGIAEALSDLRREGLDAAGAINDLTGTPAKRLCFVGADTFAQGHQCGLLMGTLLKGHGEVVVSTGFLHATGQAMRRKGFVNALEEQFPGIKVSLILESTEKPDLAFTQVAEVLRRNPAIKGIYVTEGATPAAVAKAVHSAGKAGEIKVLGMDLCEETIQAIQDGWITATLADNTFAQGHDPVMHLYNHLAAGWKPKVTRLTIESTVVDKDNWKLYWERGKGPLIGREILSSLPQPMAASNKRPLKLTVIGCENSSYWYPIRDGARHAAKVLESQGCQVDWVVRKGLDLTTEVVNPLIEEALAQGANGIALIAEEPGVITAINKAVAQGVPVITYVTEPSSLRAFLATVSDQSRAMLFMNQSIVEGARLVERASLELRQSLDKTLEQSRLQSEASSSAAGAVNALMQELTVLEEQARKSAEGASATLEAVQTGDQAMKSSFEAIGTIDTSFRKIHGLVSELADHSADINRSLGLINNVASQVNVLAFNTAVEAARAGTAGAGFKVLSNEIRKLAQEATAGTSQINKQVSLILDGLSQVDGLMGEGMRTLEMSAGLSRSAQERLGDVANRSVEERDRALEVERSLVAMLERGKQILEMVEQIAGTIRRNTEHLAKVEGASATLAEQYAQVGEKSRELGEMSAVEQAMLARFV